MLETGPYKLDKSKGARWSLSMNEKSLLFDTGKRCIKWYLFSGFNGYGTRPSTKWKYSIFINNYYSMLNFNYVTTKAASFEITINHSNLTKVMRDLWIICILNPKESILVLCKIRFVTLEQRRDACELHMSPEVDYWTRCRRKIKNWLPCPESSSDLSLYKDF